VSIFREKQSMIQAQVQAALPKLGGFSPRDFSIIVALMIPTTMALIDVGMMVVALPAIQADFNIPVDLLAWVMAVGFLLRVPLMPVFGRVGDVFGKKKLYLAGLAIYIAGTILGAVAFSFGWLLGGRLLQGLGSASTLPLAMALIAETFPEERRGRALGIWNAAAPIGMMLGPVLGGLIVQGLGWHAIFVIVAALAVVSLGVVAWLVPTPARLGAPPRVDWFGAASLALTIGGLLLATTTASVVPFGSFLNLIFWGITLVALAGLIWNAAHRPNPFIDMEVVRNRRFLIPSAAVGLRMFAHDGVRFLIVLYLANVFGQSPQTIGFFMLFYAGPLMFGVTYGGFLADRWPIRTVGALGMLLLGAGIFWLSLVDPAAGMYALTPGLAVAGLSGGISLTPFTKTAVTALGSDRVGLASGLYNTLRFVGIAVSSPLLGLLLARGFAQHGGLETASEPYQFAFQLLAAVAIVGCGVALFIPNSEDKTDIASQVQNDPQPALIPPDRSG
jgi:DHA2 family methylenomycin A resistance protein-like MFS transporter